jgi:hypothetical protein
MKINRLITEDELPDWLKNNVDEVEKTLEKDEDLGKGHRQRKDIDYSDHLTEKEFLQALEEGNLDDAVEQKRVRKQNRKSNTTDDAELDLDENEARSSFDNSPTPTPISNRPILSSKRGSIKKRLESIDPKIAPQCRLLLEQLLAYQTDDDRHLAQPFIRLPGQKQLPLYYQIIEEPIDFQRIRRKIDTYRYSNLEQFHSDIQLLVQNAQTFNCETSLIYTDSILLDKVYQNLREQLDSGLLQMPSETIMPVEETATTTTRTTTISPRVSARRGRGTRASTASVSKTMNTSGVSRRGRKRKLADVKEDDTSEDEADVSNDVDFEEN